MTTSETNRQKTLAYHNRVWTALSRMPSMTSGQFYSQVDRVMGTKTALIAPSKSASSKLRQPV